MFLYYKKNRNPFDSSLWVLLGQYGAVQRDWSGSRPRILSDCKWREKIILTFLHPNCSLTKWRFSEHKKYDWFIKASPPCLSQSSVKRCWNSWPHAGWLFLQNNWMSLGVSVSNHLLPSLAYFIPIFLSFSDIYSRCNSLWIYPDVVTKQGMWWAVQRDGRRDMPGKHPLIHLKSLNSASVYCPADIPLRINGLAVPVCLFSPEGQTHWWREISM
jgi:hypothetical protein